MRSSNKEIRRYKKKWQEQKYLEVKMKIELHGKLGAGKYVLVDDDDYEKYSKLKWNLSDTGYAVRKNKGKTTRLHREIMNCPDGKVVDHLNGNRLDCRKNNLRICSQKDNARNRHSNDKHYCYDKSKQKYIVRVNNVFCGRYETESEAKEAVKRYKSGQEYQKTRRKYYMLPKHISKQAGRYVVSVQVNNRRYRKTSLKTLEDAISWRDQIYTTLA